MNKLSFVLALSLLTVGYTPAPVMAADTVVLDVRVANPIAANLEKLLGKKVTVRLQGGSELSGKVSQIGAGAVLISELTGQEFFDAVVELDSIVAVIARVK